MTISTLNIGLAVGDRDAAVTERRALDAILARTGDTTITYAIVQSATEKTLVAVLEEAATDDALWAMCADLEQDCIAQQVEGQPGQLVGPRAGEWGPFNPEYFISWDDARREQGQ